jgi:hypothetical protein
MKVTAINYGQFLINSHINFTGTYFADTVKKLEHDSVYRYLKHDKLTPRMVWEKAKKTIQYSDNGRLIFDDTVADKNHSQHISPARSQFSGAARHVITGIGIVNCLYYNPELDKFWVIDFRVFDPDSDGKTKLQHVEDMLKNALKRQIPFTVVLMDTWYATKKLMVMINDLGKIFYCPLRSNRLVDDSGGRRPYRPVKELAWSADNMVFGKRIKISKFPKHFKVQLFRVAATRGRTEYVVTNATITHNSFADAQKESRRRWKIEQLHREEKQLTGLEKCQVRLNRSQRNHICLATLAWIVLRDTAESAGRTIYQQKLEPLQQFVAVQWRNPATTFSL